MKIFNTTRTFDIAISDLKPVADEVGAHFDAAGYEVEVGRIPAGWLVSLHKGGTFKAILGMKTALNLKITRSDSTITANADVGLFGTQAIPTLVMFLAAWPVLFTQIWGLVRQSKLDDEAIEAVASALERLQTQPPANDVRAEIVHCSGCGITMEQGARFCHRCGLPIAQELAEK